jgi:IS30 family transposase
MTYDNGTEMSNHKWLSNITGVVIYFTNPYSSWERGTNENTNCLIRRFFPKELTSKRQLLNRLNKLHLV